MNRFLLLPLLSMTAGALWISAADPLSDVAVLAARQDAEERYKRLAADVQTLLETQDVIQKRQEDLRQRLDKFADELRSLKDEQGRSTSYVSRDEFRKFVEKLKEVDDKREADKKLILDNIKDLAKAPPPPVEPKPQNRKPAESSDEPAFVYVIKNKDRLLDIIAGYNDYFQKHGQPKITLDQVLKANPGLKPERLIAGRKIRIPAPAKDSK